MRPGTHVERLVDLRACSRTAVQEENLQRRVVADPPRPDPEVTARRRDRDQTRSTGATCGLVPGGGALPSIAPDGNSHVRWQRRRDGIGFLRFCAFGRVVGNPDHDLAVVGNTASDDRGGLIWSGEVPSEGVPSDLSKDVHPEPQLLIELGGFESALLLHVSQQARQRPRTIPPLSTRSRMPWRPVLVERERGGSAARHSRIVSDGRQIDPIELLFDTTSTSRVEPRGRGHDE